MDKIKENIMELTLLYTTLLREGKVMSFAEISDRTEFVTVSGCEIVKEEICRLAEEFETIPQEQEGEYLTKMEEFGREKLVEKFGRKPMDYNLKEQGMINHWLGCNGTDVKWDDMDEYVPGQLIQACEAKLGLIDWDAWQQLERCMGKPLNLSDARQLIRVLWENGVEPLELETEESKEYEKENLL